MATDQVQRPLQERIEQASRRLGLRPTHLEEGYRIARFLVVGGLGYIVNLASFALMVHVLSVDFRVAAVLANVVGFANNLALNRAWTFDTRHRPWRNEVLPFVVVSCTAIGVNVVVLDLLVREARTARLVAEMAGSIVAAPVSYIGNRTWTFRDAAVAAPPDCGAG